MYLKNTDNLSDKELTEYTEATQLWDTKGYSKQNYYIESCMDLALVKRTAYGVSVASQEVGACVSHWPPHYLSSQPYSC